MKGTKKLCFPNPTFSASSSNLKTSGDDPEERDHARLFGLRMS